MKTIKTIIFLAIISIFFWTCKKENNLINQVEIPAYKLGKLKSEKITESNGFVHTINYEYNSKGKLSKYNEVTSGSVYGMQFNQIDSTLNITYSVNETMNNQYTALLNYHGFITKETRSDGVNAIPFWYKYNTDGFLTDLYENWQLSTDTTTYYHTRFEIQQSNIIKQFHPSGVIYTYGYYTNYTNNGIYQIRSRDMAGLTLYPGYYGNQSVNLIKFKVISQSPKDTLKYEYSFYDNGKVKNEKCKDGVKIIKEKEYTYY